MFAYDELEALIAQHTLEASFETSVSLWTACLEWSGLKIDRNASDERGRVCQREKTLVSHDRFSLGDLGTPAMMAHLQYGIWCFWGCRFTLFAGGADLLR
jgi:hypothetical protein